MEYIDLAFASLDEPVPSIGFELDWPLTGIMVKARPYRRNRFRAYERFTLHNLVLGMAAFLRYVWMTGEAYEMFGYVFVETRQVGYLTMSHEWPPDYRSANGTRNGTEEEEVS